jgi:hypothetical protein
MLVCAAPVVATSHVPEPTSSWAQLEKAYLNTEGQYTARMVERHR